MSQHREFLGLCEHLYAEAITTIQSDDLLTLAEKLISIYDAPSVAPIAIRDRAAHAVAKLAAHDLL
jgi:hypothetical protein